MGKLGIPPVSGTGDRRFKSGRLDLIELRYRITAIRSPVKRGMEVRSLLLEPFGGEPQNSPRETWFFGSCSRAHRPTGRHRLRTPRIRVQFPVSPLGNKVPWSRGNDSWLTTRQPWFESMRDHFIWHAHPRAARSCTSARRGALVDPGSFFDELPIHARSMVATVLVEQPGVLACLSRRRSGVQIPSRTLVLARYANRQSGEAQTFVPGSSNLPRVTRSMRRLGIGVPKWL